MLYENISEVNRNYLQWDKRFRNRYALEADTTVSIGRFALVRYDEDVTDDELIRAYEYGGGIYVDAECTQPFTFVEFVAVNTANASNYASSNYFLKVGTLYHKVTSDLRWSEIQNKTFYQPTNNTITSLSANMISPGQYIRVYTGEHSFDIYLCVKDEERNLCYFQKQVNECFVEHDEDFLNNESQLIWYNYISNYSQDEFWFSEQPSWEKLGRGYDNTIWQKVYSEGVQKWILIAHLNTLFPQLNIVIDKPKDSS